MSEQNPPSPLSEKSLEKRRSNWVGEVQQEIARLKASGKMSLQDNWILRAIADDPEWTRARIIQALDGIVGKNNVYARLAKPHMQHLITMIEGGLDDTMFQAARAAAKNLFKRVESGVDPKAEEFALKYAAQRTATEVERQKAKPLPTPQEAIEILKADPAMGDDGEIVVEPLD